MEENITKKGKIKWIPLSWQLTWLSWQRRPDRLLISGVLCLCGLENNLHNDGGKIRSRLHQRTVVIFDPRTARALRWTRPADEDFLPPPDSRTSGRGKAGHSAVECSQRALLTRAWQMYFHNTAGRGPWNPGTSAPILKIQTAFNRTGKFIAGNPMLMTLESPMTSQVVAHYNRIKWKKWIQPHGSCLARHVATDFWVGGGGGLVRQCFPVNTYEVPCTHSELRFWGRYTADCQITAVRHYRTLWLNEMV